MQLVFDGESALFEDEETRQFYENLPDLKSVVPQILYKESSEAKAAASAQSPAEAEAPSEEQLASEINVDDLERELSEAEGQVLEEGGEEEASEQQADDDFDIASSMKLILDEFLQSLAKCVNREMIDKAANDFALNLNTKANRRKLTRALFSVHRTRYDLLPFYSRLVAILNPLMPDVALDLGQLLKSDFRYHVRKKDQVYIETKLKIVRYIGELVKFKLFPKADVLHCVKVLSAHLQCKYAYISMACSRE